MASLSKELLYLVMQYLDEEKFKSALHELERESGVFFNMKYFDDLIINGEWEQAERYLSGFTKVGDNRFSMKMFFEIRKQRYLEALDKPDLGKAVEILRKDLKLFGTYNEALLKDITHLLTLNNFRENPLLSTYVDDKTARAGIVLELRRLIEASPQFRDKLHFPNMKHSRLRALVNQSLNWQHHLCKIPKANPEIKTLFSDHTCGHSSPVTNSLVASVPKVGGVQMGSHGVSQMLFQPIQSPQSGARGAVSSSLPSTAVSTPKRPISPLANNSATNYQPAGPDHILKRLRPHPQSEEVNNLPVNVFPMTNSGRSHVHSACSSDDLPKNVVVNLIQNSAVTSMDFHPSQQTLLLVGTDIGDFSIWEVCTREKLIHEDFKVWDIDACSMTLQAALSNEYTASANRVIWSPDGTLFGVAYSKHIIHLYYFYHGGSDCRNHLEIEGHVGNVSDVGFSSKDEHLYFVTCGEDKLIKVWDAVSGSKLYTFVGHEAPVYSVCPHYSGHVQFILSTDVDGKIKAWVYDDLGPRIQYEAPGSSRTTMTYSADGTRLFSCGTNKEGESYLVEWNESNGTVKRSYSGLGNRSIGVVQLDTTKNKFLAVGDEFVVKIWDMDEQHVIKTIHADGGLPASPCIRFNKQGTLLAISTSNHGVKVLVNAEGPRTCNLETSSQIASSSRTKGSVLAAVVAPSSNTGTSTNIADRNALGMPVVAPVTLQDGDRPNSKGELKTRKLSEINEASQIRSFRLPDNLLATRVVRLTYTNSGSSILALQCNGLLKLWKWQKDERNLTGMATTAVPPQFWHPTSGILMVNDTSGIGAEEAVPCLALSKNDSYVVSATGGRISLFNLMNFKKMTTILPPPPAATCLAFDPQDNNNIAIGMEDATIQIYHVRVDEAKMVLKGHQKRVTGLAFSNVLGILVSSGADAQVCVWSKDDWERRANRFLQVPHGRVPNPQARTHVQFYRDQMHVLVVHETQIAIYEAPTLDSMKQWVPGESGVAITDATYSCDGQSVYVSLDDGSVHVLTAESLQPKCRIKETAYFASPSRIRVYPVSIAAHPWEPNQFAIGLSDGGVHVLEPQEAQGKWGDVSKPTEESSSASTSSAPMVRDQVASR